MSGRCKACNQELDNPPRRAIEEFGVLVCVLEEDLCPKCLDIAMGAVHDKDLTDDQLFLQQFGQWEAYDDEWN